MKKGEWPFEKDVMLKFVEEKYIRVFRAKIQ